MFKGVCPSPELMHLRGHNLTYTHGANVVPDPLPAQNLDLRCTMPRVKNTASRVSHSKAMVMKKLQKAASKAGSIMKAAASANGLIHTGKLKVPFKPASAASIKAAKKGLLKQLKRRYFFVSIHVMLVIHVTDSL